MTSVVETKEVIENANIAKNNAHVFISRKSNATNAWIDWKYKSEIHWGKYKIKESDISIKDAYVLFYRRRGLESMVDLEKTYMKKFKDYTNKIATIKKSLKKESKHKEK